MTSYEIRQSFTDIFISVRQLTVAKPTLITWSGVPGKIKNHLFSYNEEMGFTPEELKGMTLSCPTLLMTNVKLKVIPQFELLHNEAKIPHSILVKFPQSLLASWIDTRYQIFLNDLPRNTHAYSFQSPTEVSTKSWTRPV